MSTIAAVVRNGRIESKEPLCLPEGTELKVSALGSDDGWDTSPEAIEARIAALESLEPLIFTPEERAAWEAAKHERKEWEKAHFDEYSDKLIRMWK